MVVAWRRKPDRMPERRRLRLPEHLVSVVQPSSSVLTFTAGTMICSNVSSRILASRLHVTAVRHQATGKITIKKFKLRGRRRSNECDVSTGFLSTFRIFL
jgi:hypothetical protein